MKWSRTALVLMLALTSNACFLLKTDERVDVLIAATDLAADKQITDRDITIIAVPVSTVTPDVPRKKSQVLGHTTKTPIPKGGMFLLSQLK